MRIRLTVLFIFSIAALIPFLDPVTATSELEFSGVHTLKTRGIRAHVTILTQEDDCDEKDEYGHVTLSFKGDEKLPAYLKTLKTSVKDGVLTLENSADSNESTSWMEFTMHQIEGGFSHKIVTQLPNNQLQYTAAVTKETDGNSINLQSSGVKNANDVPFEPAILRRYTPIRTQTDLVYFQRSGDFIPTVTIMVPKQTKFDLHTWGGRWHLNQAHGTFSATLSCDTHMTVKHLSGSPFINTRDLSQFSATYIAPGESRLIIGTYSSVTLAGKPLKPFVNSVFLNLVEAFKETFFNIQNQ